MPFDSAPEQADDLLTFSPGREGLRKLATLLRMQMPPRFRWNFMKVRVQDNKCGTVGCAIGLAMTTWPEVASAIPISGSGEKFTDEGSAVARLFNMPVIEAFRIFYSGRLYECFGNATPTDVADAIDAYLARTS